MVENPSRSQLRLPRELGKVEQRTSMYTYSMKSKTMNDNTLVESEWLATKQNRC